MNERMAPIDYFSNIPLPIVPVELPENALVTSRMRDELARWDLHHPFYPNASLKTEGQRVVRHSRVQLGPRYAHDRYHRFFDNARLPETEAEEFAIGILAVAGYIPEKAVDVSGKRPYIHTLDSQERQKLRVLITPESRITKRNGKDQDSVRRGSFFMKHVLKQGLDHVWPAVLDEFLDTPHHDRRQHLGFLILAKAMERAAEPIDPLYRQAYNKGFIPANQPKGVVRLMQKVTHGYVKDYFGTLREQVEISVA